MYIGITNLERFILESLAIAPKSMLHLCEDLGVELRVCHNCIKELCSKNLIVIKDYRYALNPKLTKEELGILNSKVSLSHEFSELIEKHIEASLESKNDNFALKKVYLQRKDKKILEAMLKSMDSFLKEIHQRNKKQNFKTKDKTYIFWGFNHYKNALSNL